MVMNNRTAEVTAMSDRPTLPTVTGLVM
jgi:hypothetical protein